MGERVPIPEYMQLLFEHYCRSFKAFGGTIWLNPAEFACLEPTVRRYLADNLKHNFLWWLQKECDLRIRSAETFGCFVRSEHKTMDRFWSGRAITLKEFVHTVHHEASGESVDIHIRLKLKKGIKNDRSVYLMVKIQNQALPHWIRKLRCELQAFCPQIAFSCMTAIDISQKMRGFDMCPADKLEPLHAFEWKICMKFRAF